MCIRAAEWSVSEMLQHGISRGIIERREHIQEGDNLIVDGQGHSWISISGKEDIRRSSGTADLMGTSGSTVRFGRT